MCHNLMALIGKALKDEEVQLEPGRYEFDEVVTLHVCGSVKKEADTTCSPTVSIPLIATLALFWEKSGITWCRRRRDPRYQRGCDPHDGVPGCEARTCSPLGAVGFENCGVERDAACCRA